MLTNLNELYILVLYMVHLCIFIRISSSFNLAIANACKIKIVSHCERARQTKLFNKVRMLSINDCVNWGSPNLCLWMNELTNEYGAHIQY